MGEICLVIFRFRSSAFPLPGKYALPEADTHKKSPRNLAASRAEIFPGSDLLSHAVAHAVPSARQGLTSVFGMGTGGTPALQPPGMFIVVVTDHAVNEAHKAER